MPFISDVRQGARIHRQFPLVILAFCQGFSFARDLVFPGFLVSLVVYSKMIFIVQ